MIDCFISHVWRQSEQWVSFEKFLYEDKKIEWRNFSLPWHDPALKVGSGLGKKLLMDNLVNQILPSKIFFLLESLYEKKSNFFWLDFQLNIATEKKIPIIFVPNNDNSFSKIKNNFYTIKNNYTSLHDTVKKLNL